MNRGAFFTVTAAALALSGCLGDQGKLEIRSVDRGIKEGAQPVSFQVAEAYGQLAIGNVALALEGFRKAEREDPSSMDALAGMAQCYDKMGRFDLSRRYYEQALARAPQNQTLLTLFAASLDLQGERSEAASVRAEMASLTPPASAPATETAQDVAATAALAAQPPETAAPVGKSVTIALAPAQPAKAAPIPKAVPKAPTMNVAPVGKSVTIALAPLPPAPPPPRQPRIERLSLTEVALITGDGPKWMRPAVAQPVRSASHARQQKIEQLADMPVRLRVLNAARVDKLAARTRTYLGQFGWRNILVGNAAVTRPKSLILYPQAARAEAMRLSNRFGFAMAPRADVKQLTILLGRDAAGHPALRPAP
ncbi:LytR C-terminal domain-containing protein [Sphingomonas alba]|uniref:LytR C-terminal domain-containing protein n=1 Tax=Sphingomonas alba TaxID=2908208 RepID=A0ABT0RPE0_9SPHN|nr:LytR C-terminal domain-containing protein [Sphingomonas alba]MCL6684511.1 LytR C-terminal domain-containing protein [Sphingomonas alba]